MEVDPFVLCGQKGGVGKVFGVEWELTVSGPPPITPTTPHSFHMDEAVAMETSRSFMGLEPTCLYMYRPVMCLWCRSQMTAVGKKGEKGEVQGRGEEAKETKQGAALSSAAGLSKAVRSRDYKKSQERSEITDTTNEVLMIKSDLRNPNDGWGELWNVGQHPPWNSRIRFTLDIGLQHESASARKHTTTGIRESKETNGSAEVTQNRRLQAKTFRE